MNTFNQFNLAYQTILSKLLDRETKCVTNAKLQTYNYIKNFNYTISLSQELELGWQNSIRPFRWDYLKKELLVYFSQTDKVKEIAEASKFWQNLTNPDGETVNSIYGSLIFKKQYENLEFSGWDWCIKSLIEDNNTRQAVFHFNSPKHLFNQNKDVPCTMYGIFDIEDNKINLTIHQRSCDIFTGFPYDVCFFIILIHLMKFQLNNKIHSNLQVGKFTHCIDNLHVYEKDKILLTEALQEGFKKSDMVIPNIDTNIQTELYCMFEQYKNTTDPSLKETTFLNFLKNNPTHSSILNSKFISWLTAY